MSRNTLPGVPVGPVRASFVIGDMLCELNSRNPHRAGTLNQINLRLAELNACKAFHQDPTPENLTAWCDAHEALEDAS